ncbi:ankyrin repeat protein [Diplodia corticola]|uniref:Ankyrin repeat protein n=1 Tax=Diplodia corticola TaxID=236234 RepID=A0A1J9QP34_9PEZI|nr:ankyrin repeat protein [Diplodia corticola]OJD30209.1 ankyrin repeat protein [Diplodia corticola]
MATHDEVFKACIDQPLDTILSLASTCSNGDEEFEKEMCRRAVKHNRPDLLDHLLRNATASSVERRSLLLLDSATYRSPLCVDIMLTYGFDINMYDDMIGGVLNRALTHRGCPESFLAWLIDERGALVNHPKDWTSKPPCLVHAVSHGTIPQMKLLVARGADVDFSNALHCAVGCGYVDKAQYLVEEAGTSVNKPTGVARPSFWYGDAGSTPLHVAAAGNEVATAEYLLQRGAHLEAKNANGRTPLQEVEYIEEVAAAKPNPRSLPHRLRWLVGDQYRSYEGMSTLLREWETRKE